VKLKLPCTGGRVDALLEALEAHLFLP
jgi:hypothetical protein